MKGIKLTHFNTTSWLLVAAMVLLTAISAWLYFQKEKYQSQNRELIIENDSLSGANIDLLRSIEMRSKDEDSLVTYRQPAQ